MSVSSLPWALAGRACCTVTLRADLDRPSWSDSALISVLASFSTVSAGFLRIILSRLPPLPLIGLYAVASSISISLPPRAMASRAWFATACQ